MAFIAGSCQKGSNHRCLLQPATTALMLTPVVKDVQDHTPDHALCHTPPVGYGMGWLIRQKKEGRFGGREYPFVFSHTGGAVGACSVLTVMADDSRGLPVEGSTVEEGRVPMGVATPPPPLPSPPQGVAVAVIFNLQEVKTSLFQLGMRIAEEFYNL